MWRRRLVGAAMVALQLWQAPAASASPPLSSVDALGPGVGVLTLDAGLADADTCTAGFLVRGKGGRSGILMADHCDKGGPVTIKLAGTDYTRIGSFDGALRRGDIGFVALAPGVPVSGAIAGVGPVSGATDRIAMGDVLCKVGLPTGLQCGPVTGITPDTVTFAATTQCGDSGGPVYTVRPDGSLAAVGILSAQTMGEGTIAPPCGTPFTFAIAQRLQPWLRATAMSVVTT
ncbi:hypothetical protein MMAD_20150 [Mycolicibacterium madagascariense]|uniref:Trypsin n=1 Tax=Mycolicibacterium madagascariense TaxID=212765 RepID=A0A7I7XEV5_9MYCO|nr:endopeptidase [Mycolicibacterium madagascariense]MCV7015422.1 endopeptidase [Mycolicibacterium madagascariense]BBZ27720.1 hypothetical protein MMAD_20150 [Mycolicibacterium madagascariense]